MAAVGALCSRAPEGQLGPALVQHLQGPALGDMAFWLPLSSQGQGGLEPLPMLATAPSQGPVPKGNG